MGNRTVLIIQMSRKGEPGRWLVMDSAEHYAPMRDYTDGDAMAYQLVASSRGAVTHVVVNGEG